MILPMSNSYGASAAPVARRAEALSTSPTPFSPQPKCEAASPDHHDPPASTLRPPRSRHKPSGAPRGQPLQNLYGPRHYTTRMAGPLPVPAPSPPTILVVDDDV